MVLVQNQNTIKLSFTVSVKFFVGDAINEIFIRGYSNLKVGTIKKSISQSRFNCCEIDLFADGEKLNDESTLGEIHSKNLRAQLKS